MAEVYKKIGDMLIDQGLLTEAQLKEALEEQRITGEKLGEIVVGKGWLTHEEFDRALSVQTGITTFDLPGYIIEPDVIKLVPEDMSRKYKLIPVFLVDNNLTVAMANPTNVFIIDELHRKTGYTIEPVLANEIDIRSAQDQYYGASGTLQEIIASIDKSKEQQPARALNDR